MTMIDDINCQGERRSTDHLPLPQTVKPPLTDED